MLHIQLLGGFHLSVDSSPLSGFHQPRRQLLLTYLLLHRYRPQSRQQIAFLFWPDTTEKQAHTNLRKLIYSIRRALPEPEQFLEVTTKSIQWRADAPCIVDVVLFEERIAAADASRITADIQSSLEEAIAIYAGDLLPGAYDEWLLVERERLCDLYANALKTLIKLHEDNRDYDLALSYAQRLLHQDRFQESTYRLLMRLHLLQNDRAAALRTYHLCATMLREELAVEPSAATEKLRQRLLRMEGETGAQYAINETSATIPLVGRHQEWLQLRATWEKAQEGHALLLLIQGEAGIGKTRLAEELADYARRQGMIALHTRAYAAQGAAYTPIVNLLRSEPHFQALNNLDDAWLVELSRLLPELSRYRSDLPEPQPMREAWQQRLFQEALARGFLAVGQPLLLHFDDLQWCDSESLAWLRFLLEYDLRAQLLVVGTVRDDEINEMQPLNMLHYELRQKDRSLAIDLQPLDAGEAAQLATQVAGHVLSNEITTQLFAETEGSPLFIVELLRSGDYAAISVEEDTQAVNGGSSGTKDRRLPPKIQAVIKWRLGQLSPPARQMAAAAAVIGRSFTYELLSAFDGQQPDEAVRALDELWRRRIIREQGESGYDFSHDYIRDVAYNEISPIRRRHLHQRVAQTLRDQDNAQLDPMSAQIAAHYEGAGLVKEALIFFERAGDYAMEQYANKEAAAYYARALSLLPDNAYQQRFDLHLKRETIFARTSDMESWYGELQKLERILHLQQLENEFKTWAKIEYNLRLGGYESQGTLEFPVTRLEEVIHLAQEHNQVTQEARAQRIIGGFFFSLAQYDLAKEALSRALELATKSDLPYTAAKANEMLAAVSMFSGANTDTIERYIREALDYSQSRGDVLLEAACYAKLGFLYIVQGEDDLERAREYSNYGLTLGQDYDLIIGEILNAANLGILCTHTGEYDQGEKYLDLAMSKAKDSRFLFFYGYTLNYLAFLYFNTGDYKQSEETQLAAIETLKQNNRPGWLCKAYSEAGLMDFTLGRFESALEYLECALSIATEIGDDRQLGYVLTRQGRLLIAMGRFPEAKAAFETAIELHLKVEQFNRVIMALGGLAELSLAIGELNKAHGYAEQILKHLQRQQLDYTDESLAVYMSAYWVLRAVRDNRANKMLQMAYKQLKKRVNSLDDEAAQKIFWEAPPHAEVVASYSKLASETH